MKIVIFAGGLGTRLWPLSRQNLPKQFQKIVGDKSTLQLTVERYIKQYSYEDIYISTNSKYVKAVFSQVPLIKTSHVIEEPEIRDFAPAVGLACIILCKSDPYEPAALVGSDYIIRNEKTLLLLHKVANKILKSDPNKLIHLVDTARFANTNIAWAELGNKIGEIDNIAYYEYKSFKYRPERKLAEKFLASNNFAWNTGHYLTTPSFILKKFLQLVPDTYKKLQAISAAYGTNSYNHILHKIYPSIEKVHFDNAIAEKIPMNECILIKGNIGWCDIGNWESLKEALQISEEDTVVLGKTLINETKDSLIYNYTDKNVVTVGLKGIVVIETPDVTLVTTKKSMAKVKKLVETLTGTDFDHIK